MITNRIYKYASIFYKIAKLNYEEALDIFELPRDFDEKDLKKLYKKKVFELHPDRNSSETAEEDFKLMHAAYELLQQYGPDYDAGLDAKKPDFTRPPPATKPEPKVYTRDYFLKDDAEFLAEYSQYTESELQDVGNKIDFMWKSNFFYENFSMRLTMKRERILDAEPKKPSWTDFFKKKPGRYDPERLANLQWRLTLEWSPDRYQKTRMIENFYGKNTETYLAAYKFMQSMKNSKG